MKRGLLSVLGISILAALALFGCSDSDSGAKPTDSDPSDGSDPIVITDRTGKEWDVTYAVRELGFRVGDFNFGLGPNAIPPIVDPDFILPGQPGYPSPDAAFRVLGMTTDNDQRAYSVAEIAGHEVVNDRVGDLHFAATY